MAGSLHDSDDEMISQINITPLVDVVLVLLVIFLITAPVIYQSAIKVQLPKASSGEKVDKGKLDFVVSADGKIQWDNQSLDWPALTEKLKTIKDFSADQTASISADQSTTHGTVVKLMDLLRNHGLVRFALNVDGTQ